MSTLYSQLGGSEVGGGSTSSVKAPWPFAKITVADTDIRVTVLGKSILIPKDTITRIGKRSILATLSFSFFTKDVEINYAGPAGHAFVIFQSIKYGTLKKELEAHGYTVRE